MSLQSVLTTIFPSSSLWGGNGGYFYVHFSGGMEGTSLAHPPPSAPVFSFSCSDGSVTEVFLHEVSLSSEFPSSIVGGNVLSPIQGTSGTSLWGQDPIHSGFLPSSSSSVSQGPRKSWPWEILASGRYPALSSVERWANCLFGLGSGRLGSTTLQPTWCLPAPSPCAAPSVVLLIGDVIRHRPWRSSRRPEVALRGRPWVPASSWLSPLPFGGRKLSEPHNKSSQCGQLTER